jgi:uncharacterized protein YndB with AHSA1/START domain
MGVTNNHRSALRREIRDSIEQVFSAATDDDHKAL